VTVAKQWNVSFASRRAYTFIDKFLQTIVEPARVSALPFVVGSAVRKYAMDAMNRYISSKNMQRVNGLQSDPNND
jgi:hypothetical protein